jgi:hypothetical protein
MLETIILDKVQEEIKKEIKKEGVCFGKSKILNKVIDKTVPFLPILGQGYGLVKLGMKVYKSTLVV